MIALPPVPASARVLRGFTPLLLVLPLAVQGQTFFTGANNAPWSDDANWSAGKPGISQYASINGNSGGSGAGGLIRVDASTAAGGISFSGSTAKTVTIDTGAVLTLHGYTSSGSPMLISNAGNATHTFLGEGTIQLAASGAIHVQAAARSVNLRNAISETGGSRAITKTGAGTLQVIGDGAASTFSGGIRVAEGTLTTNLSSTGLPNAPTSGPFGTGMLTFADATRLNYSGSSSGTLHNAISVEGGLTFGTGSTLTLAGNVDLNGGSRSLEVTQAVIASGVISNGGLTKGGSEELQLRGVNTYSGATRVEAGKLTLSVGGSLSQSSGIEVAAGATFAISNSYALAEGQVLSGEGHIEGTLRTGHGLVNPGTAGDGDGIGTLTVSGNGLLDGGTLHFDLSGSGHDQLLFTGDGFSLTGNTSGAVRITLADPGATTQPGEYLLISTSGLTNATFSDWSLAAFTLDPLPPSLQGVLRFEQNNLYFDFQPIPEPATYALLPGALGLLLALRRRSSRA